MNNRLSWRKSPPTRSKLLQPVENTSKPTTDAKNAVVDRLEGKDPHEVFQYFFNDELKECIITETNRYASQHNDVSFQLNENDLNTFVGILLLSGYNSLPRTRMYWEKEEDVGIPLVYESMRRSEFEKIKNIFILLIMTT